MSVAQVTTPSEPVLPSDDFMSEFSMTPLTWWRVRGFTSLWVMIDAKPFCVRAPQTVPFAYREKLKAELELLQQQGIIAPVTTPTEWCAPIVVTPKKDSERIRLCTDLSHLNKYVKRERYQLSTPTEACSFWYHGWQCRSNFTKFDALKGYHQCPIVSCSPHLSHPMEDSSACELLIYFWAL
jgi:hypothetical protein